MHLICILQIKTKKLIVTFLNSTLVNDMVDFHLKIKNLIEIYKIQKKDDILIIFDKNDTKNLLTYQKVYNFFKYKYKSINNTIFTIQCIKTCLCTKTYKTK